MPTRPAPSYNRKTFIHTRKSPRIAPSNTVEHGSPLLDIPQESLTHITSYLGPPSLVALARTCRYLCEHVDDDNTWFRAFLTHFFGIGPERELENERILLLKRIESTWRKEFILRCAVGRRWECSRNPTVAHSPQTSSIDGVHLISQHGLLTSSIQYGIVARSIPLNGKVLKGYIDASGTGLRIGNPNVEFTPNISVCAMTSGGGTARVFWGKRSGEVALTVVNRVMDSRAASKFIRCSVGDQHEGIVHELVPDSASDTFLSAAADGRIKLWDSKSLNLLWSTDKQQVSLVVDPFIKIAGGLGVGFVVGALKSGDILLYDLLQSETPTDGPLVRSVNQLRIPPLIDNRAQPSDQVYRSSPPQQIAKIWLSRAGETSVLLLVQYTHHSQFYRVHANTNSRDVTITPFGTEPSGDISVLEPVFSSILGDNSMALAGDVLGFVSIYDISVPLQASVAPAHRFEAHDDPVTAISWSPIVFATGTDRGAVTVWDSLTLAPMRCFTSPAPRPAPGRDWDGVSRILVDEEFVIIVVGNRVLAWKVGHGHSNIREWRHGKAKHANNKLNITTKGHQQYEMYKDVAESYMELEYERAHAQRIYGREREQRSSLNALGLSELEAVEYILMLSREEEETRQQRIPADEGVFEGDFDDLPDSTSPQPRPSTSAPTSLRRSHDRRYPLVSLPVSSEKVQVSPPLILEPMEAGTSTSPLSSLTLPSPMTARTPSSSSLDHFPAISSSLSSTSSSRKGTSGSPEQPRSAWSTPLRSVLPSPGPSSPRSRVVTPVVGRTHSSNMSLLSADIALHENASRIKMQSDDSDEDLKLAIELSLAEARSRGEAV